MAETNAVIRRMADESYRNATNKVGIIPCDAAAYLVPDFELQPI